ncbi:MAG: FAD-dependent oxidoreductase, partial [Pseudomonadota bacterium]
MAQWECIVCGIIYDEAQGWPDDGIAPGTLWKDVPEDWLCPDCGVGKEDFEIIEGTEGDAVGGHTGSTAPIVIIGSGLSGYTLVRELRKIDKDAPIIMVTRDDGHSYSKPMLSTGYTKNKSADDLIMKPADGMAEQLNIDIKAFTEVTSINADANSISIKDGDDITYSKLVLAWGASTINPPLKGDATDDVFSINDRLDYAAFRGHLDAVNAKKIAIIGGGLIGCEFTNDLINGGYSIDAVDPLAYCLPTLLPEAAGKAVQSALEELGATFHFGKLVTEVNKAGDQLSVSLNDGSSLTADAVVSAIGVRPRLELAQAANIECNRGIVANEFLETSADNIYTLGDCAEVKGHVLFYVAPLMACARSLAKTLTGEKTAVRYPAMPVGIKTPACPVMVSPPPRDADGEWEITQDGRNVCAEFRNPQGSLLGFALTGDKMTEKA